MTSLCNPDLLDLPALVAPLGQQGALAFEKMSQAYGRAVVASVASASDKTIPDWLRVALLGRHAVCTQGWWRPEIGIAHERFACGEALSAATQLAIAFEVRPGRGHWAIRLPRSSWFLISNELTSTDTYVIPREPRAQHRDRGKRPMLLPTREASELRVWSDPQVPLHPPSDYGLVDGAVNSTLTLLDRFVPEYATWILRSIKALIPISMKDGYGHSASELARPGLVVMSFPMDPVLLGEALVHEASHQHFCLGQAFTDYCEPRDVEHYYSPIRGVERPLTALLLAYHAVGNMVLYYTRLVEVGFDPRALCSHRLGYWTEMVGAYERTFAEAEPRMTPAGRGLWRTLQERVAAARREHPCGV